MKVAFVINNLLDEKLLLAKPNDFWFIWDTVALKLPGLKNKHMYKI